MEKGGKSESKGKKEKTRGEKCGRRKGKRKIECTFLNDACLSVCLVQGTSRCVSSTEKKNGSGGADT